MAQVPIEVKLPGCDGVAHIRSFVKNKERKAVQRALVSNSEFDPNTIEDKGEEVSFNIKAVDAVSNIDIKTKFLLLDYNGNSENPYEEMMESEFEEDMDAVETAVARVFDKNKSKEAVAKK